ncbi:hypothetical protein ACIQPP_03695 [Streptomyces violaceusniger]|uniref:hypothetical protein n=1 Tax=Streptomyces violaceusniger TaxID=68280 RepID=UPI000995EC34|nr:hypothetical protein [Streptomyces hygroscopicus]AQW53049.1 hypothetical protein SHXM_06512 [Streptomyces hygroscopicus]
MSNASDGWQVGPAPGHGLRPRKDGLFELPLHVRRPGRASLASLVLTVVEAEQLHAALCYALGDEPAPENAPECRKPIRYPGGRQKY